jgi:hypothetical protein
MAPPVAWLGDLGLCSLRAAVMLMALVGGVRGQVSALSPADFPAGRY